MHLHTIDMFAVTAWWAHLVQADVSKSKATCKSEAAIFLCVTAPMSWCDAEHDEEG